MRPPARLACLLACLLAIACFAGCGSDTSGDALDSSLGYLPEDTPFAVAVNTDVHGEQYQALDTLFKKLPFGEQIKQYLIKSLANEATGLNLQDDVVPLLGNPFVVGAASASSLLDGSDENGLVAAIRVSDRGKLDDLLDKTKATEKGEQSGAKIYQQAGTEFAVDGDNVVFAGSRQLLNQALARHDGDKGLDEDTYKRSLEDVGENGIAQGYVNVQSLLGGSRRARGAREVKWIGAIQSIGLNASVQDGGITIDFRVHTDPKGLTDADLPIAPGADAPAIVERPGEIGIGVRDIGQIVGFIEKVAQAVDPSRYRDYLAAKALLEKRLHVDVQKDLLDQLSGDISASVSRSGDYGVRVEPKDPAAFERTLARIAGALPSLAKGFGLGDVSLERPKGGEDLYALARPDGKGVVFGVKRGVFVVASDARRVASLALDKPAHVTGAKGSVVVQADTGQLAAELLGRLGDPFALSPRLRATLTRALGLLTGSLEADTSGVTGKIRLGFD